MASRLPPADSGRSSDWDEPAVWAEHGVFFDGIPIVRTPPPEPVQPEPTPEPAPHHPGPGRWWWTLPVVALALVAVVL